MSRFESQPFLDSDPITTMHSCVTLGKWLTLSDYGVFFFVVINKIKALSLEAAFDRGCS